MIKIAALRLEAGLPEDTRVLRQLAAAVAISRGEALPGAVVPDDYVPLMRSVHAARCEGATWRGALEAAGLEVPEPKKVAEVAHNMRRDLQEHPIWTALYPAVAHVIAQTQGVATGAVLREMRDLMT